MITYEDIVAEHEALEPHVEDLKQKISDFKARLKEDLKTDSKEEIKATLSHIARLQKNLIISEKQLELLDIDIMRVAFNIMEKGDPVEFIMSVYNKLHVGDAAIGKVLLLSIANVSILNSEGLQPKLSGGSGKGKTHAVKAMFHLIPDQPYKLEGSLSAKSLFHNPDIVPGMIIFSDDIRMSLDLEDTLKRSMSNFQQKTFHRTLGKNQKYMEVSIPERISWWLTAVESNYSDELLNRLFDLSVDDSPDQDDAVINQIFENAVTGKEALPETNEVKICRAIIYVIKRQLFKVYIPYARYINWHIKNDRRNPSRFLSLIMGLAVFRYLQRDDLNEGDILADLRDFEDAKEIYEAGKASQITKLTDAELKLVRWMIGKGPLSINDIVQGYRKKNGEQYTYAAIHKLITGGKRGMGLTAKVPGMQIDDKTKETRYRLDKFSEPTGEVVTLNPEAYSMQAKHSTSHNQQPEGTLA